MNHTKFEKRLISFTAAMALFAALPVGVSAMHISEGYLSPIWCVSWGVLCIPFLIWGVFSIKKSLAASSKNLILLAMCGAFAFVLSALKIPSVTGSCSHPTGVGLGAVLFGPAATAVIGLIVLLFQALLLAHGGLSTLGANTFSMAIAGPFLAFLIFWLVRMLIRKYSKKENPSLALAVFAAAFLGDLFTYVVTSFQLAMAFPDPAAGFSASFLKFLTIFAVTQIPLAISEGILTVVVYNILVKYCPKQLRSLAAL